MCFMMPPHCGQRSLGRLAVAAVMAHQPSVRAVIGHRNAAARALGHLAALTRTAACRLLPRRLRKRMLCSPRGEIFLQRGAERFADGGLVPRAKLVAQIGDEHLGERCFIVASVKRENLIVPFPRVIHRLDRRRRRAEQQQRAAPARSGTARHRAYGSAAGSPSSRSAPAPRP